jgi:hypothetical protein
MKHSFVKMMNRIAEMENSVLKGFVLDEHGKWVTIADRIAVEEDTVAHLSSGQVLFEGRWVNFPELKASRLRGIEKPPSIAGRTFFQRTKTIRVTPPAAPTSSPAAAAPDTSLIILEKPTVGTKGSHISRDKAEAATETSLITVPPEPEKPKEPPPAADKEHAVLETSIIVMPNEPGKQTAGAKEPSPAPVPEGALETSIIADEPRLPHDEEKYHEEFAPETKIILFKPPDPSRSGVSDTQVITKAGDTQIVQVSKPALPAENAPLSKNRLALILGTVVVVAALAAILFIVLQMAR